MWCFVPTVEKVHEEVHNFTQLLTKLLTDNEDLVSDTINSIKSVNSMLANDAEHLKAEVVDETQTGVNEDCYGYLKLVHRITENEAGEGYGGCLKDAEQKIRELLERFDWEVAIKTDLLEALGEDYAECASTLCMDSVYQLIKAEMHEGGAKFKKLVEYFMLVLEDVRDETLECHDKISGNLNYLVSHYNECVIDRKRDEL